MKIRIIRIPNQYKYGGELNTSKWKHADGGPLKSEDIFLQTLVNDINRRSIADFVNRLKDPNRKYIQDWKNPDNIATHKLGWATIDGKGVVFPLVQNINGNLYDFTNPNNTNNIDPLDRAISVGDTLMMSPYDAHLFTTKYKNYYPKFDKKALGGSLKKSDNFNNGVTTIGNGDRHENNPFEGVQMGVDPEGNPNLVEEGEVVYNDYVFSDRLTVPKDIRKKYKLGKKNITFAEAAKKMQKESEERPNDPISKNGLESLYTMLADYQEIERDKQMKNTKGNKYANGSFLRYAPVLGSAIGLTENLLKKPDYSSVQRITDATNLAGEYTPIGYTPLGEYMTYNPFDREFYINRAAANATATRRAITNQSSGNRATAMAGILAADRAYQNSLGDLARQAEEYNLNQREKVATFNRETDRANQTASLQSQAQNQAAQARARQARLAGIQSAETLRSQIDEARNNAINANISSLFGNLGEIGQDEFNRASVDWWLTNVAPRLSTKPPYWSNKQWNDYLRLHGENILEEPTRRERKKQKNEIKNDYNYTTPIDYSGDFWS